MKNRFMHLLYCSVLTLICLSVKAQSIALKAPQTSIVIDGDKKDWGDNFIYNAEKHLYYNLANDKQNLYLVLKSSDLLQQSAILSSGITFSIDTKGKKKRSLSITFPMAGQEAILTQKITTEEKRSKAKLTKLKKIGVKGFKDIDEDQINTENAFNIQTIINFDDNGDLIYEEAIPLQLFHTDDIKNDWTFNIKINALMSNVPQTQPSLGYATVTSELVAVPAGSGPPSSNSLLKGSGLPPAIPKGNMGPSEIEVSKAIDFWGTFILAKF